MTGEVAIKLVGLAKAMEALGNLTPAVDAEALPLYAVEGLTLAVVALAEQIVIEGLELHKAAAAVRGHARESAGLASPELLAYVRNLVITGREPGPEVGRWQ